MASTSASSSERLVASKVAPTVNFWADAKCAKAFWSQAELPAFQALTQDTLGLAFPKEVCQLAGSASGEQVLDLGCGGGTLTRGVWQRTNGRIASILGVDYAAANAERYRKLAEEFHAGERIQFQVVNFSHGLGTLQSERFDCVISGLSITYAEHWDETKQCWTQEAYDRLFEEVFRVTTPGGRFVFSVNVPNPSWWKVGLQSFFTTVWRSQKRSRLLKNLLRMNRYGRWLKQEAKAGRFHYLPAEQVTVKLRAAGFTAITHRLSYAGQAFVFRAEKPSPVTP